MANQNRGKVIIFCGPPGCGKGVQGKLLANERGYVHISTGDLFRDAATQQTKLGIIADQYIRQGKYVPDEYVVDMVKEKLNMPEVIEKGVILDGFPRTERQARILSSLLQIDRLILFQIPDALCVERVMGRRVDPNTGEVYHLNFMPPTADIAHRLVRREYDLDEKIVRKRIEGYYAQLGHILGHFRNRIQVVNAFMTPSEVHKSIVDMVDIELPLIEKISSPQLNPSQSSQPTRFCTICADAPADYLVVPCGHQCACRRCLDELQNTSGLCPICRTNIQHIIQVFACGFEEESTIPDTKMTISEVNEAKQVAVLGGWDDDVHAEEKIQCQQKRKQDIIISISPTDDVSAQKTGNESVFTDVAINIQIPERDTREFIDICCIVDVSGSMSNRASYENEDGKMVDDGLTILDIVVHSVKSVIHLLQEGDRLTIVSFSDTGRVIFALGEMTEGGKVQALHSLETLHAEGGTNLWGGLLVGMDALRSDLSITRKKTVLLLTDGRPTVTPPKGFVGELKFYLETNSDFSFQLNTFGFGYGLSSDLLRDLAQEGNGTFSFIPDARIVGTCFINCVANAVTNFSQKASLHILLKNGCEFAGPVAGNMPVLETDWGRVVSLGPILNGQIRNVVVPLRLPPGDAPYLEIVLSWPDLSADYGEMRVNAVASERQSSDEAIAALARSLAVSKTLQALELASNDKGNAANNLLLTLHGQIASLECLVKDKSSIAYSRISALKEDVEGRITKALNGKDRFNRWGKHYLRAVARAHQIEQCTNFMDPGLQPYGSEYFKQVVEEGGKIFLSLPLHTRTRPITVPSTQGYHPPPPPTTAVDTYYAGCGGGCFGPQSLVCVKYEKIIQEIPISTLQPGDYVQVSNGEYVKVVCVAEISNGPKLLLLLNNGLSITPKHPVRMDGKWVYPKFLDCIQGKNLSHVVYNVVLESNHIMVVNGMECCTWGHNFDEDDVIYHPFYGTNQIIKKLQTFQEWKNGYIHVKKSIKSDE